MSEKWLTNVDIIFYGVERIDLSTNLGEIVRIDESSEGDLTLYKISTKSDFYNIKALNYSISDSITDIFDSPLNTL